MNFKGLRIGQAFYFVIGDIGPPPAPPWVKLSPRRFQEKGGSGFVYQVGSINAPVALR